MGLDIRLPIGLMFSILGALLLFYGLFFGDAASYEKHSMGVNVNVWWGIALLVFGVLMTHFGRRGSKASSE